MRAKHHALHSYRPTPSRTVNIQQGKTGIPLQVVVRDAPVGYSRWSHVYLQHAVSDAACSVVAERDSNSLYTDVDFTSDAGRAMLPDKGVHNGYGRVALRQRGGGRAVVPVRRLKLEHVRVLPCDNVAPQG